MRRNWLSIKGGSLMNKVQSILWIKLIVVLCIIGLFGSCDDDTNPTSPDPTVYSSGQLVIRGTWTCDLDLGIEGGSGSNTDFWWQQVNNTERYIVPRNNATFSVLGIRDFDSITYSELTRLSYSSEKINGSNAAYNRIPQGAVVAYITNEGRYGKFRVDIYGYNLSISWVTYSKT